jgi:predicted ATP-grasp superfamily ATP-dependent carboligase
MREERYDLVVPCDDPSVLPLQRYRSDLEPHGRVYLLSDDTFEITSNKLETTRLARQLEIPVPREIQVETVEELEHVSREFRYPIVLKPFSSVGADDVASKRFVRKAYNAAELEAALLELLAFGPVQTQENVAGLGVGVEVLADQGRILAAFQHRRVHEPPLGGGSSYRCSVPLDPRLLQATQKLMEALDYTGVAMVEFKVDPETGRWALMEINARFWGSLPLPVAAGVDFPYFLYQLIVEGKRDFPSGYRVGLHARNWSRDAVWMWQNLKADRTDPTLMTVPLPRVMLEIRHLFTLKERSDTFTLDDPRPGLAEIWELIRKGWSGLPWGGAGGRVEAGVAEG